MAQRIGRVGKRGTLVIPAQMRRRLGLEEGSLVLAEERDGGVFIRPVAEPLDRSRRDRVLAEINEDYAALRSDPAAWQAEVEDRAVWDVTLLDGLQEEESWPDPYGPARDERP